MKTYNYEDKEIEITNKFDYKHIDDFVNAANAKGMDFQLMAHYFPFPYTREDAITFIDKNREYDEIFEIDFYIYFNKSFAGVIGISDIDRLNLRAHTGYWIAEKYRNNGIAKRSLKIVIEFAARELKLHSLYTKTHVDNIASINVLLSNGFKLYGIEPDSFYFNDKFYPAMLFSLQL